MRVWLEDEKHLIVEGNDNFNNAGFVDTQRAIPARWVELIPVSRILQQLEAELARKDEALREIQALANDYEENPHGVWNRIKQIADKAREALNGKPS